jgi:histone-lysine N-methyltransferase SETD2
MADLFSPNSPKAEGSSRSRSRSPTPPRRSPRVKFEDEVEVYGYSQLGEPSRRKATSGSGANTPTTIGPTLVPELPLAWDDALQSFEALDKCVYERKDMGLSREQDEMMVCDCVYDPGE